MTRQAMASSAVVLTLAVLSVTARAEVAAPTPAVGHYEEFLKNRYISIDPTAGGTNLGKTFAIRVTLTESLEFSAAEGMSWWVGEPDENCRAGLFDSGATHNWDACPALHIGDCGIVPVSEYTVVSVDFDGVSPTSLVVLTIRKPVNNKWWGDAVGVFNGVFWTGPQGVANFEEIAASFSTFQGRNRAPPIPITDIHPRVPNRIVNIDDVFFFVKTYQGEQYPFGCPDDPCWDKLVSPCP